MMAPGPAGGAAPAPGPAGGVAPPRVSVWRALQADLRPYRWQLALAVAAAVAGGAVNLLLPVLLKLMVDGLSGGEVARRLAAADRTLLLLAAVLAGQAALSYVEGYSAQWVAERVTVGLRGRCFDRLLHLPMAFFRDRASGELAARLTDDVGAVREVVASHLPQFLRHGLVVAAVLGLLLYLNLRLTLVALGVIVLIGVGGTAALNSLQRAAVAAQDSQARVLALVSEALRNLPVVKSFVREAYIYRQYLRLTEAAVAAVLRRSRARAAVLPLTNLVAFAAVGFVIRLAIRSVISGGMSAADLVAYFAYAGMMAGSVSQVTSHLGGIRQGLGAVQRAVELLAEVPEAEAGDGMPGGLQGELKLVHVTFAYAGQDQPALRQITLHIPAGTTLALVGPSGAGKSTIAHLLTRLYAPQQGAIYLDGRDLQSLPLAWVREQVGIGAQETYLFAGTIRDNIRLGRPGASDAEVEAAAREANVCEFVQRLPAGYDTLVGEHGARVSRGQAQRIAIARLLLKDPRIVILDEATASLDSENEELVQEAVRRLTHGRTTLLIAHRFASLRGADRVAVLLEGRVVEEGTHAELVQQGGLYARLYHLQVQ